jgi:hypothetical protein
MHRYLKIFGLLSLVMLLLAIAPQSAIGNTPPRDGCNPLLNNDTSSAPDLAQLWTKIQNSYGVSDQETFHVDSSAIAERSEFFSRLSFNEMFDLSISIRNEYGSSMFLSSIFSPELRSKAKNLSVAERRSALRRLMTEPLYGDTLEDEVAGFENSDLEASVYQSLVANRQRFGCEETWCSGHSMPQSAYRRIYRILSAVNPQPGQTVIDLGAGYGRVGVVVGLMFPGVKFIGYEIVPERVQEANRVFRGLGISEDVQSITQDLSDPNFRLPYSEYYYYWSPVRSETGRRVLSQIQEAVQGRPGSRILSYDRGWMAGWDSANMNKFLRPEILDNELSIYVSF